MKLESTDLKPIADLINLVCSGSPQNMKSDLYLIIYLLHLINHENVVNGELERAVFCLKELCDSLQSIHDHLDL